MITIFTEEDYIKTDDGKEYLGYEHSKAYYNSELVLRQRWEGARTTLTVIAFRPESKEREHNLKFIFQNAVWGEF